MVLRYNLWTHLRVPTQVSTRSLHVPYGKVITTGQSSLRGRVRQQSLLTSLSTYVREVILVWTTPKMTPGRPIVLSRTGSADHEQLS
jgi:hypothetical protein